MSTNTPAVNFNKRTVQQEFQKHWNCQFKIELCDDVVYAHNDLNLDIEIPYSTANEKAEIYNLLALLATRFDFSYSLEFDSLSSLREWHEAYNHQQPASKNVVDKTA